MDIESAWKKALKHTEIIRARVQSLLTNTETKVPYILLSESSINMGDTIVRKGQVVVERPSLIIPPHNPQFEGFDFAKELGVDENSLINFLLIRGISLPSLHYDNVTNSMDIYEGRLSSAIEEYKGTLQKKEDVATGLITGPEDCWQFSLLLFISSQIIRNADIDIRKLLDEYKRKGKA